MKSYWFLLPHSTYTDIGFRSVFNESNPYFASLQLLLTLNCPSHSQSPIGHSSSSPWHPHTVVKHRTKLNNQFDIQTCVEFSRTNDSSRVVIRNTLPRTSQSWVNQQRLILSTLQLTSLNIIISFWSGTVTVESLETMMTQKSQWKWLLLHDIHQPPRFDHHSHTLLWCCVP